MGLREILNFMLHRRHAEAPRTFAQWIGTDRNVVPRGDAMRRRSARSDAPSRLRGMADSRG